MSDRFSGCPMCRQTFHDDINQTFRGVEDARDVRARLDIAEHNLQNVRANLLAERDSSRRLATLNSQMRDNNNALHDQLLDLDNAFAAEKNAKIAALKAKQSAMEISHKLHEVACRTVSELQTDLKKAIRCVHNIDENASIADRSPRSFFHNAAIMKPRKAFWNHKIIKSLFGKYAVREDAPAVPCENTFDDDLTEPENENDNDSNTDDDIEALREDN